MTRDKAVGQGNGLFGSWKICSMCDGVFQVESGHARLIHTSQRGLHVSNERIPYSGTLIVATIDFSNPKLLQEALSFGGVRHDPVDYIQTHFEADDMEEVVFQLQQESVSLGSRRAGEPVRLKIKNVANMSPGKKIVIDFSGISLVSSSFADEVIAKLFAEVGAVAFMARFELRHMSAMVSQIVDRSIQQRLRV